jgi:outer membrane protein OmpA-like peptidoglycan-associated protein
MTFVSLLTSRKNSGWFVAVFFLIGWLAGCATPSPQQEKMAKDSLEQARSVYLKAKNNPNVEAYAPVPLIEAGKAVEAAGKAKGWEETVHRAYLAEKRSLIAIAIAERKKAERETEALGKETAEILLQKREGEAKLAKMEAEEALRLAQEKSFEAQRATEQAETRARQVEAARKEAEARARQLEAARMQAEVKAREAETRAREAYAARLVAQEQAAKAAKAQAEAEQLAREISDLKAQLTERGVVLTIGDVLFAVDQAKLEPRATRSVQKLADFLKKHPKRRVLIEGFTDITGSDEYNLTLSQKRADAVKEKLIDLGIDTGRITSKGYGKKYPVADNDTPEGRQQNRRVEVVILNEGVAPETQFRKE